MNVLVIGGTLFIGRGLVAALLKSGHDVTILHRKPGHDLGRRVKELVADRNDPAQMREALANKRFEIVYDNVYDWRRGTTAAQVEATAQAVASDRLYRYVFMSSVAAYGDGLNHHEGDALAPDNHPDMYVRNKAMSERALFRMHQKSGFPVVTMRPPFLYGPGNAYYREAFFWDRMRDNRPIILPGDGRRLMQFAYVKDLVESCVTAGAQAGAGGHAFNIGNLKPLTQHEAVLAMAEAAGKTPKFAPMARAQIVQLGGHAMGPQLYFGMYFDLPAITMVVNKAQRMLKFTPTSFSTGLKETYKWYLRHHEKDTSNYAFEDKLIASAAMAPALEAM